MDENGKFKLLHDKVSFKGRFISFVSRHFLNKETGKNDVWEMVERKTHGRIVCVLPVTKEGDLILVKIFRFPLKDWIIESIAGLMDAGPEEEISLARKEMAEESGYASPEVEFLCRGHFTAGLTNEELSYYVGLDAIKVGEPDLEDAEDIEVLEIPFSTASEFLREQQLAGVNVDVKLFGIISLMKEKYQGRF